MDSLTADDRLALIKTFSFVKEKRHNAQKLDELADRLDRHRRRGGGGEDAVPLVLFSKQVQTPLTLGVALEHVRLRAHFRRFVESKYAKENLDFAEAFEDVDAQDPEFEEMEDMVNEYCRSPGAPSLLNLPSHLSQQIALACDAQQRQELYSALQQAHKQVLALLEDNFFHAFLSQVVVVQDDPLLIA
ncbi:hypothetical protein BASA81_006789 [Batrachochytrium salamandrivorans]|nr:hypothetical protein BASA81_006789 [Batrachochytrium salamandrivorans]